MSTSKTSPCGLILIMTFGCGAGSPVWAPALIEAKNELGIILYNLIDGFVSLSPAGTIGTILHTVLLVFFATILMLLVFRILPRKRGEA